VTGGWATSARDEIHILPPQSRRNADAQLVDHPGTSLRRAVIAGRTYITMRPWSERRFFLPDARRTTPSRMPEVRIPLAPAKFSFGEQLTA